MAAGEKGVAQVGFALFVKVSKFEVVLELWWLLWRGALKNVNVLGQGALCVFILLLTVFVPDLSFTSGVAAPGSDGDRVVRRDFDSRALKQSCGCGVCLPIRCGGSNRRCPILCLLRKSKKGRCS